MIQQTSFSDCWVSVYFLNKTRAYCAYCAYRTDYELDVDIDGIKNELLAFNPSKIRQNQRGTAWTTEVKELERKRERKGKDKKRVKGPTRGRPEEDVA